jgi:hypothetical protein
MATDTNQIPANVVLYLHQEIQRRTEYKKQLEQLQRPPDFEEVQMEMYQAQRHQLREAMSKLTSDIVAITKKRFPDIEIDSNDEVTISNVLASLPAPEETKRIKVISSRLGAPS